MERYFLENAGGFADSKSICFDLDQALIGGGKVDLKNSETGLWDFNMMKRRAKQNLQCLVGKEHLIGTCQSINKLCLFCAAWESWKAIVSGEYDLKWNFELRDWTDEHTNMAHFRRHIQAPYCIDKHAMLGDVKLVLPDFAVTALNEAECLNRLSSIIHQLAYQRALTDKSHNPIQEEYNETLERILRSQGVGQMSLVSILLNDKIHLHWNSVQFDQLVGLANVPNLKCLRVEQLMGTLTAWAKTVS